jgi:hypothetical protein
VLAKQTEYRCKTPGCQAGVAFQKTGNTTKAVCKKEAGHAVGRYIVGATVDNVAFIAKEDFVHTISKELISDRDFIKDKSSNLEDEVDLRGETLAIVREEQQTKFEDERMGGAIFTLDGITFGCEVCLDHIATNKDHGSGRLQDASHIQIQLIPSGGMNITQFRTVENGVIFNVDGSVPRVQVLGRRAPDDIRAYMDTPTRHDEREMKAWNPEKIAPFFDPDSPKYQLSKWDDSAMPAPAAAPRGSVIQYGPFEIPKVI